MRFLTLVISCITIISGARKVHEDECEFRPIPCPNLNNTCGKFRKSELDEHFKVCVFIPCKHHNKGEL